jgi:hypothetical protein
LKIFRRNSTKRVAEMFNIKLEFYVKRTPLNY